MNWIKWLRVWFTIQWNKITGRRKEQEKQRKRIEGIQNNYRCRRYPPTTEEVYESKLTYSQTGLNNNVEYDNKKFAKEYADRNDGLLPLGLGYLAGDILNYSPPQADSSPSSDEPTFSGFGGGDTVGGGSSGSWDSSDSSSSDSSSYDSGSSDSGSDSSSSSD